MSNSIFTFNSSSFISESLISCLIDKSQIRNFVDNTLNSAAYTLPMKTA